MAFKHHIDAANGYIELDMFDEAALELEEIELKDRQRTEVLFIRLLIYSKAEKWDFLESIAKGLCKREPDKIDWWGALGRATRKSRGSKEAIKVYAQAI